VDGPAIEDYLDEMVSLFTTLHDNGVIRTSALDDLVAASERLREVIPLIRMCDTASRGYDTALQVAVAETQLFLYDRGMTIDELSRAALEDEDPCL
jgi:hypothetical protein